MNTKNNARRRASREKLERAFVNLLQTREPSEITVSELCGMTGLNRSTFYANYLDIYDLADQLREQLSRQVNALYDEEANKYRSDDWLKLFYHIKENQLFYKTYFKLGYDTEKIDMLMLAPADIVFPREHMAYHIEFFRAGLNAMIKTWLANGCPETPEQMSKILKSEYRGRY